MKGHGPPGKGFIVIPNNFPKIPVLESNQHRLPCLMDFSVVSISTIVRRLPPVQWSYVLINRRALSEPFDIAQGRLRELAHYN